MSVLHKCDEPACCRPDHLFLGTIADNNWDMTAKGRRPKAGHPSFKRGDDHWTKKEPSKVARGEHHTKAVVNEEVVRAIREMANNGVRQNFIAEKFGISKYIVSYVIRRKTWKHVA
jgi:hypothetical protein